MPRSPRTPLGARRPAALLAAALVLVLALIASTALSVAAKQQDEMEAHTAAPEDQPSVDVSMSVGCPDLLRLFSETNSTSDPFLSYLLHKDVSYAFFSVHFARLLVPQGASVVLRAVEDFDTPDRLLNVTAALASDTQHGDFSTGWLRAKELRVEVYRDVIAAPAAAGESPCYGFVVDKYAYDTIPTESSLSPASEAICKQDNSVEAICYYGEYPTAYRASRAVVRMLTSDSMGQSSACTGWLVGSENHLLTNNHCVKDALEATQTMFEFMADARACNQSCQKWGACEGPVEAMGARVVHTNAELDYTLLQLVPVDPAAKLAQTYGYLRLKAAPGYVGQTLYIPQHPVHYGKRIAMFDDYGANISLMNLNESGCASSGYSYTGDTQIGSSGSPVIDSTDHGVVALHRCGQYCANIGIPAALIVQDLEAHGKLPKDAVDYGDNKNTANFPPYAPPPVAALPPLTPQLAFDGAIRVSNGDATVSVDQFEFALAGDGDVEVDVLSTEISDDGDYKDVNGDCRAQYMDAVFFLFVKGSNRPLKIADDSAAGTGRDDGSVSFRDPYLRTFLKKGSYMIALGSVPLSADDAYSGGRVKQDNPKILDCRARGRYGAYRISVRSTTAIEFKHLPDRVVLPSNSTCTTPASAICTSRSTY